MKDSEQGQQQSNTHQMSVFDQDDYLINQQCNLQRPNQSNNLCPCAVIILIVFITHFNFFSSSQEDQSKKTIKPLLQIIDEDKSTLDANITWLNNLAAIKPQNQTSKQMILNLEQHKQIQNKIKMQQNPNPSYPSSEMYATNISQQIYEEKIYAGQIHYSRIPFQYWQHRILMLKAMGLNTLSTYVMWNYHEVQRGEFDYETGNKNLTKFLGYAVKHKMKVLLRPGPYVCGEWDFGGLPARLLGIQQLIIRTHNLKYLQEVKLYFQSLVPIIKPFLNVNKGPIKLIQIENQLGSFSNDSHYTQALVNMWKELGIISQFYIEDSAAQVYKNYFEGAAIGLSGGTKPQDYQLINKIQNVSNDTLVFGGQIYTGWMTHWGQKWGGHSYTEFKAELQYLFKQSKEFSLYMAYGGTNFGLTAGANAETHELSYEPMITSYDYDATITQQGRTTNKSDLFVSLMTQYVRPPSISFPQPIQTIEFDDVYPKLTSSLLFNLGEADLRQSVELYYFQHAKIGMYKQGIILYETYIIKGNYSIDLVIHDFALVFQDYHLIYTLARIEEDTFRIEVQCTQQQCRLLILVEAMGHNNYGQEQQLDIKGLIWCEIFLLTQQQPLKIIPNWNLYKININQSLFKMDKLSDKVVKHPAMLKQTFNLSQIGDTYIDMHKYKKGYVWINGHNLGRYWKRGPQFRLYCPGVWLKKQNNQIVILQLLSSKEEPVRGQHRLSDIE